MATSSITHNFVINDKTSVRKLIDALSMPKSEPPKPTRQVSDKEAVELLMSAWENAK